MVFAVGTRESKVIGVGYYEPSSVVIKQFIEDGLF